MLSATILYFVQPEEGGLIKIGITADFPKRLGALRNSSPVPLRVLGIMPGGRELEEKIFFRFRDSRKHGEWFEDTPELQAFITSNGARAGAQISPCLDCGLPTAMGEKYCRECQFCSMCGDPLPVGQTCFCLDCEDEMIIADGRCGNCGKHREGDGVFCAPCLVEVESEIA